MEQLVSIIGNFIAKHLLPKGWIEEDSDLAGGLGLFSLVIFLIIFILIIKY